jgi:hypothetical protein
MCRHKFEGEKRKHEKANDLCGTDSGCSSFPGGRPGNHQGPEHGHFSDRHGLDQEDPYKEEGEEYADQHDFQHRVQNRICSQAITDQQAQRARPRGYPRAARQRGNSLILWAARLIPRPFCASCLIAQRAQMGAASQGRNPLSSSRGARDAAPVLRGFLNRAVFGIFLIPSARVSR